MKINHLNFLGHFKRKLISLTHLFGFVVGVNLLAPGSAWATLDIELTQAKAGAIPIAQVPFACNSQDDRCLQVANAMSAVIRHDFQMSGRFGLLSDAEMPEQPHTAAAVNFKNWQGRKVDDLVVGNVTALGGDRYQVDFSLLDVYSPSVTQATLLKQNFVVAAPQMRMVAHRISDLIYQRLTGFPGVFSTKLAYVVVQHQSPRKAHYRLEVADVDGFNPHVLLDSHYPIMSPAWSPDARQLAYVSYEGGRSGIYLQNISTGQRTLLSSVSGINGAPAFSPDGRNLALVLSKTGNPNIYMLDMSTHQLTPVTNSNSIDTEANWSPDGKNLIFTSDRGGAPQIYRYNLATRATDRLTFRGNYNAKGNLSPDGRTLVVMHREQGESHFGIAKVDLISERWAILADTGRDESPTVAPNGQMIAYATQSSGQEILAMVSINGDIRLMLPAANGEVQSPAWSPLLRG